MFQPRFPKDCYTNRGNNSVRWIVVHHSETRSPEDTLRVLTAKHFSTHFEIDRLGVVHQYLDPATAWAMHAGPLVNRNSIGIDLTRYGKQEITTEQMFSLDKLIRELRTQFPMVGPLVAPDNLRYQNREEIPRMVGILRHRNVAMTLCPGTLTLPMSYGD